MSMNWSQLLVQERLNRPDYAVQLNRPLYLQDADRITFSAPFRRLANKTQVHPLNEHDHIHHRLIHSVETASVGRSLGMSVGHALEEARYLEVGERHTVAGIVQAACLAHDIGNPPFGHAGESAMGDWFATKFDAQTGIFGQIEPKLRNEFMAFEGNAQGFRLIANLEMYRSDGGMQLSHSVLGAFTKYPVTARVQAAQSSSYCGLKKFGVFETEKKIWETVATTTGLIKTDSQAGGWWCRHPLVFLVEAADDICYNILDLEDAFTSGDLSSESVCHLLEAISGKPNKNFSSATSEERISYLRAKSIGNAIHACVDAFLENYTEIMSGQFSSSLIEESRFATEFQEIKETARERIFKARRKTEMEVSGRNIIWRALEGLLPVFDELGNVEWDTSKLPDYHSKLVRAVNLDLREATDPYKALHSLSDFVSGMTDRYAASVAKMVSGIR